MIKKVQIQNYFKISKIELELKEKNFLIGNNNTNKTTFCDALFFATNGFSQLYHDIRRIKGDNQFSQINCWLESVSFDKKMIKVYLEKYKTFYFKQYKVKPLFLVAQNPTFFVSSQTLNFEKIQKQSHFFNLHISKFDNDYRDLIVKCFKEYYVWLNIRSKLSTNDSQQSSENLFESEKKLTHYLYLIWEKQHNFVTEINKNIIYLCQQFFPQLKIFNIKLISWFKNVQQKNVGFLQKQLLDFWKQKRHDKNFKYSYQIPIINDTIQFFDLKTDQLYVKCSWTTKNLIRLILHFAIAWYIKHNNKKITFIIDGFDFLDENYRHQIMQLINNFDQIIISSTNNILWPVVKYWKNNYHLINFNNLKNENTKPTPSN